MINLFCGYDEREAIGFHVFVASVLRRASQPVSIHALGSKGLPTGSNAFTFSRFLVPCLMEFKGHAIFVDGSDMLMLADIAELDSLFDPRFAVQCVQHPNYSTRHRIKYRGTDMECPNRDYARKNWASVMIMNCEHDYWRVLDHDTLETVASLSLLQFGGLRLKEENGKPPEVAALPDRWNRLVDEGQPVEGAAVLHWTAGIPAFKYYHDAPGAEHWHCARAELLEVS
jgi:hypothetical protein